MPKVDLKHPQDHQHDAVIATSKFEKSLKRSVATTLYIVKIREIAPTSIKTSRTCIDDATSCE